ncbi:MAG: magnesium transporter [Rhodospirillales bacterium]|nr:magnesium transporter [Alphaproteobacteria bacterium]MCB1839812.1 magnesium transporter [Alphaproteobacteria bacterium]MCB9976503.1 magnesium transporter [Rhodospirillales bacterium]
MGTETTSENQEPLAEKQASRDPNEYQLTDADIKDVVDALRAQDADTLVTALDDLSSADTAELLSKIKEEDREELLSKFGDVLEPETFVELDTEISKTSLSAMSAAQVAQIISELESDDALLLLEPLDAAFQKEIMKHLSAKMRLAIEEGLSFPEDSAGRLMNREVVAIPEFWTVGKTLDYLRAASESIPESFFDVFVINPSYHLVGVIPLSKLVRNRRSGKIKDLITEEARPIPAEMDQEQVAHLFRRNDIVSAPVVDQNGRLLGVITIDDVVDVIDREAEEDILQLAGVGNQGDIYNAVITTAGNRFRWLFINLWTAILASVVISFFDATIEQIVALAVLMPIVASMGGNAGTQALTVAVRAIATREVSGTNTWRVIWKETLVGAVNGVLFAALTGLIAGLWFHSALLGLVIALAMIINLIAAGLFGAGIPLFLEKIGSDPAISSSVLLTTVTDVVGFLSFLGLASLLLI